MRDALRLAIEKLPASVSLRAKNAFDGFDRARVLLPVDREMASFRAITAEEEAITALFLSLQLRKYPGAGRLDLYSHPHKAAVAPFLAAVKASILGSRRKLDIRVTLDFSVPSITVQVPLKELGVALPESETLCLQLAEPLGLLGAKEDGPSPTDFFDSHIARVTSTKNVNGIRKFIHDQANIRNKLLYASDRSLPKSEVTEEAIEMRQKRADTALLLAIAVLQEKKHQMMARQCLAAFLKMIGKALEADPSYPQIEPDIAIKATEPG